MILSSFKFWIRRKKTWSSTGQNCSKTLRAVKKSTATRRPFVLDICKNYLPIIATFSPPANPSEQPTVR